MEELLKADSVETGRARDAAYRYLASRSRSILEVRKKLREKGFHETAVEIVIKRLIELGLLDDRDFALRMARELVSVKGCGRYYIDRKLKEKGIAGELAGEAIETAFAETDEAGLALRLALKKIKRPMDDPREKARIGRFLQGRGFSWDIIREVVKELDERKRDQE